MFKALVLGILLGILLVVGGCVFLFFDRACAGGGYGPAHALRTKIREHGSGGVSRQIAAYRAAGARRETNFLAGAQVYKHNCAVCHGLPDQPRTNIAEGMAPRPPQLFQRHGRDGRRAWETYWKAEGGIRMTGMPGFKGRLSETQIWQVTVMLKNADKISAAVKAELLGSDDASQR